MKYIRNEDVIGGRLHDEMVMMDIEKGEYFSLNPVATEIWDLLNKPMTSIELCEHLISEYEVDLEICLNDVNAHLSKMLKLGLVKKVQA